MSDELGGQAKLLWENNSWAFSHSDNSGRSDDKKGKKPLILSSNTPTPTTTPALTPTSTTTPSLTPTPTTTPSSPVGPKRSRNGSSKNGNGGGESDHEIHIWTERERRRKMRNMFSNLHALLPQLPPKADKSTIVDEAVSYIRSLQQTLQNLQKQKIERFRGAATVDYEPPPVPPNMLTYNPSGEAYLADQVSSLNLGMTVSSSNSHAIVPSLPICFQTWYSPNVVLNVCGNVAQISVCAPKKLGLFTTIVCVLEKHRIDVVTAQISSDLYRDMFMINVHVSLSFPKNFRKKNTGLLIQIHNLRVF
ncbi:hypothetical protein ACHQM5_016133 [Ranunculus cassubicifolius]